MNMKTDKQKAIYQAAAKLFGEKGFEGASMDEIAEKAKVAKGTIFYHFKNKEDLFYALIEEGIGILSNEIKNISNKKIGIQEKIDLIIRYHFTFFKKYSDICLMILGQAGHFQKRWHKGVDLIRAEYFLPMEKIIIQGKKENVVNETLETEGLVIVLFSLLAVSGMDWAIFHKKLPQQKMIETVKVLLFKGFINN